MGPVPLGANPEEMTMMADGHPHIEPAIDGESARHPKAQRWAGLGKCVRL